jgi:hypothetical protein
VRDIFNFYREMRCMRHKIHIGLFLTYIFADLAWIITALLQVGPWLLIGL